MFMQSARQATTGYVLHSVTLTAVAASAQDTEIGTIMCATTGQRDYMVHSEITRGMPWHSPSWAPLTLPGPVLC